MDRLTDVTEFRRVRHRRKSSAQVPRETVWKIAEGFLIALVWWLEGTKLDNFALFWPLATRQIEAYSEFPDSLSTQLAE